MMGAAALLCVMSLLEAATATGSYVMTDSNIYAAVYQWLSDSAAAAATYGHISTWDTSRVTDMFALFNHASSFNEDIGAWDTSGVTTMRYMFMDASAFDQDIGWCVADNVNLQGAFIRTQCESTSCGVVGCPKEEEEQIPVALIACLTVAVPLLAIGAFWFYRRRKASMMMDKADEPSGANPEPTELSPPEEAMSPKEEKATISVASEADEALTKQPPPLPPRPPPRRRFSRAEPEPAAKAKAVETAERPGLARKLSSFLFGEEEEPTALAVAEAEDASTEQPQPPPPPAEPALSKAEDMYNRIAAWYNDPENAALRATWGAYPEPEDFQTWPGFVAVTNTFLRKSKPGFCSC